MSESDVKIDLFEVEFDQGGRRKEKCMEKGDAHSFIATVKLNDLENKRALTDLRASVSILPLKGVNKLMLDLNLLIFSLKLWRHYLHGVICKIFMDHKNLKSCFNHNELNMPQRQRWLEIIKDFEVDTIYHPEKANKVAEVLSRRSRIYVNTIMTVP